MATTAFRTCAYLLCGYVSIFGALLLAAERPAIAEGTPLMLAASVPAAPCEASPLGSPYIPMDSWMYESLSRLYSLGYLDSAFLGLRPWTRSSVIHMLEETATQLEDAPENATTGEAQELYDSLWKELNIDAEG